MRDFHTGTSEKYKKDRKGGQIDGEPIEGSPLARLMHEQTVLAARIVGYDGVRNMSINVDADVLQGLGDVVALLPFARVLFG